MHSKQFTSFDEAIDYMEERGKLKFYGRVGDNYEYATYTLIIGNTVWHVDVRDNGYLRVTHQRYKRDDE